MNNRLFAAWIAIVSLLVAFISRIAIAEDSAKPARELPAAAVKQVDFVRDIQPIFQRACVRCHGDEKQKGEYRLDVREVAMTGGDSYAPNIHTGKSAESPLIQFVAGTGDLIMPPDGERLSAEEIGLLRAWIDQGVTWPDSASGKVRDKKDLWSIKPLVRPPVPGDVASAIPLNPIDAFIRKTLADRKFAFSIEAERTTLVRRVYFDLTGLPPSPEDVDSFASDPDPNAYDKLVNRLLESPRYGERWARHWIDAAHFAETHGHDQDRIRENAWPYRDYLISAFNSDKPYGRFIQEQIAADVLSTEETSSIPGLGFLAAGPWDESSLRDIREDTLDRQIARYLDRDDMLTNVISNVSSLTVHCARCHDHKFDPISQADYYALQAVFSGVERANRKYDSDASVDRQRIELTQRKKELENPSAQTKEALLSAETQSRVAEWERQLKASNPEWITVDAESFTSTEGATLTKLEDRSILSSGTRPDKDTVTIMTLPLAAMLQADPNRSSQSIGTSKQITAVRLEVLTDDSLPNRGPGRCDNGNFHLTEFQIFADDRNQQEALANPSADFNQNGWEIGKAIDRNDATAWGIDPKEGMPHQAIFELKEPINVGHASDKSSCDSDCESSKQAVTRLRFVLQQNHGRAHLIGRLKISITTALLPLRADKLPDSIVAAMAVPAAERTETQRLELARLHLLEEADRSLNSLPAPSLVYAAAADFEPNGAMHPPKEPRTIHLLHRGDIRHPRDEIFPGTLGIISNLPSRFEIAAGAPESERRAALALWLTHKDNPLTWRSIVNRIWHHHFGRGIVSTLNDFGHMGDTPSHPELLDWLAVEFRDGGQSLKTLHRMILTSATYRQSANVTPSGHVTTSEVDARIAEDADNRLLWRMNRTRLDAESIRDAILSISGRLDLRMGGPSDRQFDLKPGIHVTPMVDYTKFDLNSDLGRRRSIYRFLFRTLPDPFMESLDCPSGDQITPVRSNSVTIQQALAMWNDAFIASHCEHIAERIQRDFVARPKQSTKNEAVLASQIDLAVRLILNRGPDVEETNEFAEYTRQHGLANFCRLLVNSNEFLFVN